VPGYAHILKGYFYTNLVGTLLTKFLPLELNEMTAALKTLATGEASDPERSVVQPKPRFAID
jgi:hypothetical protein